MAERKRPARALAGDETRLRGAIRAAAAAAVFCVLAGCAAAPPRRDDALMRAQALALLQTLNADLLSHDSATLTLERWCADHALAAPAQVFAQRVPGPFKPLDAELRAQLDIGAGEPLRYRHVRLACGTHVLSEADNWYVPARLGADMNRRLDTTDEPFGKVVKPLGFRRRTLSAELLWTPLPRGWEVAPDAVAADAPLRIPAAVLRHSAVLYTSQQRPFSVVVETYTNAVLDFGPWAGLRQH